MLFRAADIGHSAKPWDLHQEWSRRVVQEFHNQGDEEKRLGIEVSPLCEREGFDMAKSQVGFLQFICLPTWKELARLEDMLDKLEEPRRLDAPESDGFSRQITPSDPTSKFRHVQNEKQRRKSVSSELTSAGPGTPRGEPLQLANAMRRPSALATSIEGLTLLVKGTMLPNVVPGVSPRAIKPSPRKVVQKANVQSIAVTCLAQCERNCANWKAAGEESAAIMAVSAAAGSSTA